MLGWLVNLVGGGVVKTAIDGVEGIIRQHAETEEQADAIIGRIQQNRDSVQAQIAAIQAQSQSLWVSGSRPFILWVLGIALAFNLIPQHIVTAIYWTREVIATGELSAYPATDNLWHMIVGVLGLGVMHATERLAGKVK